MQSASIDVASDLHFDPLLYLKLKKKAARQTILHLHVLKIMYTSFICLQCFCRGGRFETFTRRKERQLFSLSFDMKEYNYAHVKIAGNSHLHQIVSFSKELRPDTMLGVVVIGIVLSLANNKVEPALWQCGLTTLL